MVASEVKCNFGLLLILLLAVFSKCSNNAEKTSIPRIAIIGGGIGGTVTAYELSKLAKTSGYDISLDLYELETIGGRVATTKVDGHEFETGGSILHLDNKHMVGYVESFGLHWNEKSDEHNNESPGIAAFYNGEEFVFVESKSTIWNAMLLIWRYGMSVIYFGSELVEPMLSKFKRIYGAQEEKKIFDDVHKLLAYMSEDFPGSMDVELGKHLRSQGYSDRFINEFIFMATNVNYNQNTDIPLFVGSVSLAGAQEDSLRSVEGGNKRVPEMLLARSDANLIKARVESITLTDTKFVLAVNNFSHVYDYVVIACPVIENSKNKIKFESFPDLNIPIIKYRKTVATLVHGELNHTFFHYESPEGLPNQIYSVNDELFYSSVTMISPVTFDPQYDNKVFKVFSKDVLTDEQLNHLFYSRDSVTVIPWLAYPLYDTKDRPLPFVLYDNLFYVNAIEWAASAMEMSAISGVNIALHLHQRLGN